MNATASAASSVASPQQMPQWQQQFRPPPPPYTPGGPPPPPQGGGNNGGDLGTSPPNLHPRLGPMGSLGGGMPPRGPLRGPPPLLPHLLPSMDMMRPPRMPFFIREIYKNGFLKRLPHNEKRSSALSKLLRSDRYWVVFSVHDDAHPFLELWNEPTDVATKPPQYIFPLAVCQHISPSIIPADNEWSFVINFETVAIRFSCNSRETMVEWVECIRSKLGDMNILNPKGNLYSKVPLSGAPPKMVRNPMSPLPSPPTDAANNAESNSNNILANNTNSNNNNDINCSSNSHNQPRNRLSIVDASDESNQTFTTSIYLNQTPPRTPQTSNSTSTGARPKTLAVAASSLSLDSASVKSYETLSHLQTASSVASIPTSSKASVEASSSAATSSKPSATAAVSQSSTSAATTTADVSSSSTTSVTSSGPGATSSVYLNKSSPTRHVTVIPINNKMKGLTLLEQEGNKENRGPKSPTETSAPAAVAPPHPKSAPLRPSVTGDVYSAIFDLDEPLQTSNPGEPPKKRKERKRSPSRRQRSTHDLSATSAADLDEVMRARSPNGKEQQHLVSRARSPTGKKAIVYRRVSDRKSSGDQQQQGKAGPGGGGGYNIQQRIRKRSQRSSSLGPLLDEHNLAHSMARASGNTNSLESIDSNPRQAVSKNDMRAKVQRRPLPPHPPQQDMSSSPPRQEQSNLPPGLRPPPYHPLALNHPPPNGPSNSGMPPHIPLPGLTCQLSLPPGMSLAPANPGGNPPPPPNPGTPGAAGGPDQHHQRSLRDQQVLRLRQEIAHPSGVRLTLRKRDCHNSLALVEFFGCLWVAGWKQRDFPVLYNAFHIGDQIVSVGGSAVRTTSEFHKMIKQKTPELHIEIIIRRLPFAQVFHLRREIDGQPLGIVTHANTPEIREIIPGSPAAQHGMTNKIRSFDGQTVVPWIITEINGRPLNLYAKEGEAGDRLQALGRDLSVLVQPADIVQKLRKQLKSLRSYKDYLLA